jgi:protein TonB
MALAGAFRKSLVLIMALAISASMARGQPAAPSPAAHKHIPLEVKPPDEPSSSSSPDVDIAPDATSSTGAMPVPGGSNGDSDAPVAATAVAHPPEIETYVVPAYPPQAREKGIEGRVLLMVVVDESGKVEDNVRVLDSIPMLDQAAMDAVHQWRFTPARDADGNPVRVQLEVPVRFTSR